MVSDGRVIVGLVWHRDVPSETRQIGELALRQLNRGWITKRFTKGKVAWQTQTQTTISSPLIADGKLLAMANNGNSLLMISTDPKAYTSLGRATVKAQ
jgi:hypothetical protein